MLPSYCPSCKQPLKVRKLQCEACGTEVSGNYTLPVLTLLTPDEQEFILKFIKYSGSLKEMAGELHLSYPTVRNLLNDIIEKIKSYEQLL
ncbi:MAG: DUF2089 domain-containing protein [Culturomica sp.]|jgi:hypothetical protein|nr:DUF2089 domain-containing protein [Culturomica sp.]